MLCNPRRDGKVGRPKKKKERKSCIGLCTGRSRSRSRIGKRSQVEQEWNKDRSDESRSWQDRGTRRNWKQGDTLKFDAWGCILYVCMETLSVRANSARWWGRMKKRRKKKEEEWKKTAKRRRKRVCENEKKRQRWRVEGEEKKRRKGKEEEKKKRIRGSSAATAGGRASVAHCQGCWVRHQLVGF